MFPYPLGSNPVMSPEEATAVQEKLAPETSDVKTTAVELVPEQVD
jgi:hypothetical protein